MDDVPVPLTPPLPNIRPAAELLGTLARLLRTGAAAGGRR
jgi:hypothetical protein